MSTPDDVPSALPRPHTHTHTHTHYLLTEWLLCGRVQLKIRGGVPSVSECVVRLESEQLRYFRRLIILLPQGTGAKLRQAPRSAGESADANANAKAKPTQRATKTPKKSSRYLNV
jgi:hypothetical protein